jgi:predicted nucleotidyltransferase component of viral defense system
MRISKDDLDRLAVQSGFHAEPLEKVLHLLDLLDALRAHPYLTERLVLKGGTALNLFVLGAPRLSVDVDLNYIGALDRERMRAEKPFVEQAIHAVCARQKLTVNRVPGEHAGGKWRLGYARASGGAGRLELDLNYLLRVPLWSVVSCDSLSVGPVRATRVPVLDHHELVAGKLAALFGRTASRDLFDTHVLLARGGFDVDRLRLAFSVYGAMNRRDWRTVSIDSVQMDRSDAEQRLLPLLRNDQAPDRTALDDWCARITGECREHLALVLPLRDRELEFIGLVNDRGVVHPELLTADPELQTRIRTHPALQWKALNARKGAGLMAAAGRLPEQPPDGEPD